MGLEKYYELKKRIVDAFHLLYYGPQDDGSQIWYETYWMGFKIHKCPMDSWMYQEIFYELKPDVIIETGVASGGGVAYYASLCAMMGKGEVVGIDIELTAEAKHAAEKFPAITLIEGSSVDPDIIAKVRDIVKGRNAIVILDSDHKMEHVFREMQLYKEFVPLGGYMIIEDSNVNSHPIYPHYGPGPFEAIEAFMKTDNDFEIDKKCEKFLMTFNPNGYLLRVR
jgi:cephalosporin hydroxylase